MRIHVRRGVHGVDALEFARRRHVQPVERATRDRAADEMGVQHPRHRHVVDVAAAAGEQPRVLTAAHGLADEAGGLGRLDPLRGPGELLRHARTSSRAAACRAAAMMPW